MELMSFMALDASVLECRRGSGMMNLARLRSQGGQLDVGCECLVVCKVFKMNMNTYQYLKTLTFNVNS